MSDHDRILFVDDDEMITTCFERLLSRRFNVEMALGPAVGIKAVQERSPFAVVVSDMAMPGMNGIELLTKVRETSPGTVRILLSGNAGFDEVDRALSEGRIDRIVEKPCSPSRMIEVLDEALARYKSSAGEK